MVWLLLVTFGAGVLLWQQRAGREGVAQRFGARVGLMDDFVTSYAADLIDRERVQAGASLTGPAVTAGDFDRVVAGFGYPAALLLDGQGRVLQVVPANPALIGTNVAGRYPHLRTAVAEDRPAVSPVVPSAAQGLPVVGFAVPYPTPYGRRVFSGAIATRNSPLSTYLSSALTLSGARVQLIDAGGGIVAANWTIRSTVRTLADENRPLADALGHRSAGRYRSGGQWWRYSATPIAGTPWRLSATVREDVLFAPQVGNETAGRVGFAGAALAGRARRNRRALQLSEDRFRRVFDGSRISMTLTDEHGRFVRANPAACRLFGRTQDELAGSMFSDVTHPDDLVAATPLAHDCLAGRVDGFDLDKRYVHADGHTIDAAITTTLLRDEHGQPQYFATQIIDMTERRALERARIRNEAELAHRAEQLQEANAHLADVMAMLSHDLRQPLSSIVGLGELLMEEWPDTTESEKHHDVRRMTAAGQRANGLVTDILTLAQLDAGALVARPARIDIADAVREAVAAHQISEPAPVAVIAPDRAGGLADPSHLQLILGNLLANATKYGRPPITVTVANRRDHLTIEVADRGEGVPEKFVPHLFDRFARADTGVATTAPGTGLGLYLVRQLAHSGGLDVSYRPNQPRGAAFAVTVPCPAEQPHLGGRMRPDPVPDRRAAGPGGR